MPKNLPPPLAPDTFEAMVAKWKNVLEFNESACVYSYMKSDFLRRFQQLKTTPKLLAKYFKNTDIKLFDVDAVDLEDKKEWEHALNFPITKKTLVFIAGTEKLIKDKNCGFLNAVDKKLIENEGKISFILVLNMDFTHPSFVEFFKSKTTLFGNLIFQPLYCARDVEFFVKRICTEWGIKLLEKDKNVITESCGGHLWLVKEAMRQARKSEGLTTQSLLKAPEMVWRLEAIWSSFEKSEKQVFLKVINKKYKFSEIEKHSYEFLQKTNWIIRDKISVPLLQKYIEKNEYEDKLILTDGKIIFRQVPVDRIFTCQERKIMGLLLAHQGKVCARDDIARLVWAENWEENYSDWAIDQFFSRLRKKLRDLGAAPTALKTVKGKGVLYA